MALGESLKVLLGADADSLVKDLNRAAREVKKWGREVKESLDSVRSAAATIFGVGVTAGALEFVKQTFESVAALQDQADQIGLNVEKFQELKFAANQAGVGQETLNTGLNKLSRLLGEAYDKTSEASKTFNKWSIEVRDARGQLLPLESVLNNVADRIGSITDPALRSAAAVDLMSKGGPAFINFLSEGSAGLNKMTEEARSFGAVIGEETVKKAKLASDQIAALSDVISARLGAAIIDFLPTAKQFDDWLNKIGHATGLFSMSNSTDIGALEKNLSALIEKKAVWDNSPWVTDQDRAGLAEQIVGVQALIESLQEAQRIADLPEITIRKKREDKGFSPKLIDRDAEKAAKNVQDAARAYDEFVDKLQEEYALLQLTGVEREKQQKLFEIENQLRRYGVELSQEQRQEVAALAAANAKLAEEQKKHKEHMDELKAAGRELGSEITSAFEDAVVAGKDLGEVFASLLQDIEKMVLRMVVLRPLGDALGGVLGDIGGGFFSDLFGGFRAGGGAVSGSKGYVVGERGPEWFVPGSNGSIIPNHQLGGGGGGSFSPTFNFNVKVDGAAAGDPQAAARAGSSFAMAAKSTILDIITEQRRPGGLLYSGR